MDAADEMNESVFERASKVAITSVKVCRDLDSSEKTLWGIYSVQSERWIAGNSEVQQDRTMH